ncbi:MAG: NACHT domain-containing protein, partial [Candidatus Nealsonbacteria bacterium]|nr:NACHT domain-containing protein [Candidatus Nealsonbacteria bacterium]
MFGAPYAEVYRAMTLSPHTTYTYHVFLASPGDVGEERQHVRRFFERYNRHHARLWNVRFEVIDWENYATIGVGRPQELITQQTLEKYRDSLALVVGIMAQRFGMPTGEAESGTEEEFNWALESNLGSSWPEIKWFFRRVEKFVAPADPEEIAKALQQWNKVRAFRQRLQKNDPPVFYAQYPGPSGFRDVLENDLNLWLSDADRPWVPDFAARAVKPPAETAQAAHDTVPDEFDVSGYREALTDRFDVLNFEMLDVSGAYYGGVRLWNVFIPQSVRECHEYTPRLLEMPKEHVQLLVEKGELNAAELAEAEQMEDDRRRQYLSQPIRPVLEVVDDSSVKRCVILGDPGSGKSALLRFLALRWTRIRNDGQWDTLPVPLLIELRDYHRWDGGNDKSLLRYLQEGSSWHRLNQQTLSHLTDNPDRVTLLLDGLDEIFDPAERELVINDIQRFCCEFPDLRIVITSRVVGYRPQRLRDEKFQHFMIQDFDESQVDAFLGFWHDVTFERGDEARQKRERLLKAIKRSTSIAQLAGNPLLLTMMAILNRHQELPRDRSDLYQQCARLLLHQWDVERTLG